jgi:hypothetical protein
MKPRSLFLAACITASAVMGCSGDDNNTNDGGPDASKDVTPADVVVKDAGGDASDGSCNFAVFVTDLINNHTTMTDKPSTDLGQSCVDNKNQAEFKPLFP